MSVLNRNVFIYLDTHIHVNYKYIDSRNFRVVLVNTNLKLHVYFFPRKRVFETQENWYTVQDDISIF